MNRLNVSVLSACVVLLACGCHKNQQGGISKPQPTAHITMAEGSLSVNNLSDVDIFPIVKTKMEEDFGGVSKGDFKMIGFARIDANKSARVVWAEKEFDEPKRTVVFPLKITDEQAKQTKHLEFLYKGNGVWLLNLYSSCNPGKITPLVSISGNVQEQAE